jgi:hypothetical protein
MKLQTLMGDASAFRIKKIVARSKGQVSGEEEGKAFDVTGPVKTVFD